MAKSGASLYRVARYLLRGVGAARIARARRGAEKRSGAIAPGPRRFRCAVLPPRTRAQAAKRFNFECERDLIRFCHPANLMDGT
jgi:hypothetical protein